MTTARRLSCDAAVVMLYECADGEPLSIGRRSRTIPAAIRRALQARDVGCRFPGCTHTHFLHAHHIQHWAEGGHTSMSNLVTLCAFHHKLVHEGGYTVQPVSGCELAFRTPLGQVIAPGPRKPRGDADSVAKSNRRCGINVSAETGDSNWDGERVDYDHVMFTFFARRA